MCHFMRKHGYFRQRYAGSFDFIKNDASGLIIPLGTVRRSILFRKLKKQIQLSVASNVGMKCSTFQICCGYLSSNRESYNTVCGRCYLHTFFFLPLT